MKNGTPERPFKASPNPRSRPFLVLPSPESRIPGGDAMVRNSGLRLFTKTWHPQSGKEPHNVKKKKGRGKDEREEEDERRPLTATLEKPRVLNVKLMTKIDMSLIRKEFLSIANLYRLPLMAVQMTRARRKCPARPEVGSDRGGARGADLARSVRSGKTDAMSGAAKKNKIGGDANNNSKTCRSVKRDVPEPCNTCGRSDQPERFHSHPKVRGTHAKKGGDDVVKAKAVVQKPVAIKYKSSKLDKKSPKNRAESTNAVTGEATRKEAVKVVVEKPQKEVRPRSSAVKGPRTLTCYICAREFGTTSLKLHEPKCLEKWERENSKLPILLRRKAPKRPDSSVSKEEWNQFAWEASQANLVPCSNCARTFYPDRLIVHQRSCKPPQRSTATKSTMALAKSKSIDAQLQAVSLEYEIGEDLSKSSKKITFREKARFLYNNITVEPIAVFYLLPCVMASLTVQNLSLEKSCRVNLGLDPHTCDALSARNGSGYNKTDEVLVQKLVASMMAYKNIIQSLLPSALMLFMGSWSDRHNKRKPCILLPIIGEMISGTGFLLCTYFFLSLSIEYNVIAEAVPPALTGGWFTVFMGVYSYISTISSVETRTLRIGAVSMFSNVSIMIGNALSGILFKKIGFFGVFSLTLSMYFVGFMYGLIKVKEVSLPEARDVGEGDGDGKTNKKKKSFLADFFDLKHVRDTIRVAFKHGERNRKTRICAIMILVMVIIGPFHGEMNVNYLFVRYKYGWDEMDYSMYSTFNFILHIMGTIFSLALFSKFFKLDDAMLGMISSLSKVASSVIYTFAPTPTIFYLGAIVEMFNGTSFIAMRSLISKLVPPDELGKINSLFGVCEALMPLVYGPLYSVVYRNTIDILPGGFYLMGGILTMPAVLIFGWLYTEHRRDAREEKLNETHKKQLIAEEAK